ncbi:hypothetical protein BKA70DRAFT_1441916 [Coprinopsis sp. MPI-PUGE-AT-0042]|nr:hypothetical protein BKA70DRAFT_1441916 [Coprinopsis sp. MPI-PUGE-AT-0042]
MAAENVDPNAFMASLHAEFQAQLQAQAQAMRQEIAQQLSASWEAERASLRAQITALRSDLEAVKLSEVNVPAADEVIVIEEPEQAEEPATPRRGKRKAKVASVTPTTPSRRTRSSGEIAPTTPPNHRTTRATSGANASSPPASRSTKQPHSMHATQVHQATPARTAASHHPMKRTAVPSSSPVQLNDDASAFEAPAVKKAVARKMKGHQLLADDLPPDASSLKDAGFTHFRLLTGCPESHQIPSNPRPEALRFFKNKFSEENDVLSQREGEYLIPPSSVKVMAYKPPTTRSRNLVRVSQIEELVVQFIQRRMAKWGWYEFMPNYEEGPESLWNMTAAIIFVDTFRQALIAGAYDFLPGNWKRFTTNVDMIMKIYHHIAHHYFYAMWRKEQRLPGIHAEEANKASEYQARLRKCRSRRVYMKANGLAHLLPMISTAATSDEELDPAGKFIGRRPVSYPRKRPERSSEAETFFTLIYKKMDSNKGLKTNRMRTDYIRVVPPPGEQNISRYAAFPPDMPLDYYDPEYFDNLPLELQRKVKTNTILLVPDATTCLAKRRRAEPSPENLEELKAEVMERYNMEGLMNSDFRGSGESDNEEGDDEGNYGDDDDLDDSEEEDLALDGDDRFLDDDDDDDGMSDASVEVEREEMMMQQRSTLLAQLSQGNLMDLS